MLRMIVQCWDSEICMKVVAAVATTSTRARHTNPICVFIGTLASTHTHTRTLALMYGILILILFLLLVTVLGFLAPETESESHTIATEMILLHEFGVSFRWTSIFDLFFCQKKYIPPWLSFLSIFVLVYIGAKTNKQVPDEWIFIVLHDPCQYRLRNLF